MKVTVIHDETIVEYTRWDRLVAYFLHKLRRCDPFCAYCITEAEEEIRLQHFTDMCWGCEGPGGQGDCAIHGVEIRGSMIIKREDSLEIKTSLAIAPRDGQWVVSITHEHGEHTSIASSLHRTHEIAVEFAAKRVAFDIREIAEGL